MINKMILQGRLCKSVDKRMTKNDNSVASFTIAWSEKYGQTEQSLFMNCVAWNNQAEFISKYFRKGDMVVIEGKITSRSYENEKGDKRYVTELIVEKAHFCVNKHDTKNQQVDVDLNTYYSCTDEDFKNESDDEDLPF